MPQTPARQRFGQSYRDAMSATVQYLTDSKGRKTAVLLPIEDYEKLQEDLDDLAVIAERREEATIPHAEFKRSLKRHGLSR
jgi:prevent-host-death family protein